MIGALLLRAFGMSPEDGQVDEKPDLWTCPTCSHVHQVGVYRYGRVQGMESYEVERWLADPALETADLEVALERVRVRASERLRSSVYDEPSIFRADGPVDFHWGP